jgi:hypothetical protein
MKAEFKIINDPLRPSVCTNLCTACCRNNDGGGPKIGCCSYEPEFCLFDLVFLYLHYPDIYATILNNGQIIKGYNGIMIEMKAGLKHCPFVSDLGCILPKDATTALCRLYICREAAMFGPSSIEERFDEYFGSKEYELNNFLNSKIIYDRNLTSSTLHDFVAEFSRPIKVLTAAIDRINPPIETFHKDINIEDFRVFR